MLPDLALSYLLLTLPVGTPTPDIHPDHWDGMRAGLWHVITIGELAGDDERGYLFAHISQLQIDLDIVRRRAIDLANAPRLGDARRFPNRDLVMPHWQFNRAFRRHLVDRIPWEPDRRNVIEAAILELDRAYLVWDTLDDAVCEGFCVLRRRKALQKLQVMLGEDYDLARMPSCVPEGLFAELK